MRSIRALKTSATGNRAFTLLELIVVIVIIGILAAAATIAYNQFIGRAHTSTAASNLKTANDSLAITSSTEGVGVKAILADADLTAKATPTDLTLSGAVVGANYVVTVTAPGGDGGALYYCGTTDPAVGAVASTTSCA